VPPGVEGVRFNDSHSDALVDDSEFHSAGIPRVECERKSEGRFAARDRTYLGREGDVISLDEIYGVQRAANETRVRARNSADLLGDLDSAGVSLMQAEYRCMTIEMRL